MNRKIFLKTLNLSGVALFLPVNNTYGKLEAIPFPTGSYYSIIKTKERLLLKTPDNKPFFSIGFNHIDSSAIKHIVNHNIWNTKYHNSQKEWLKSVSINLSACGFNTIGWVQEVVVRGNTHRHSRNFIFEEYQWLNMPYCHMLPFAEFHQWEGITKNPDFFSQEFEDWCDYVAREHCVRFENDPKLIGYFYIDCPTWIHTRSTSEWKGPLFDPDKLKSKKGRDELFRIATRYYKVTHDAIRRYDQNHLIFGDRYEANAPLAKEVIIAAKPYVNAITFQHFAPADKICENLNYWHEVTGMPVMIADSATPRLLDNGSKSYNIDNYRVLFDMLKDIHSCIGFHLCGAYIENRVRRRGLFDEYDMPYQEVMDGITSVNMEMQKWASKFAF